jgi:hypothetical protein
MDEGLMGVVARLPLERSFKLEHVKEVHVCQLKPKKH